MSSSVEKRMHPITVYSKAVMYGFLVSLGLILQQLLKPCTRLWVPRRRDEPPKCLQDESLGQHNYIKANGLNIHYVEKGDRSKPLMVFVHGFPEFWYTWRFQMAEFSKDYWTVALDMRGYGDTDKPQEVSSYKIDCMVEDINAVVKGLERQKFTLVGHDWGAFICWMFVEAHPEMVEKYVIMNGPHPHVYGKSMQMNPSKQKKMSWYMYLFQLPCLPELVLRWNDFQSISRGLLGAKSKESKVTNDDVEAYKYTFSKGSLSGPINYYRALFKTIDLNAKVKDIRWPQGLYLFGENDKFLDIDQVAVHEDVIPNVKTQIVKDANHFLQQDNPKGVNNAMRSFLLGK